MRSIVGIITTFATVIHFTFGCCLHPCHVAGRGDCVAHAIEAIDCDACCDDHEEAAPVPDGGQCVVAAHSLSSTLLPVTSHGCEACHCAATATEAVTRLPWSPLVCGIMAARDGEAIVLLAIRCDKQPPDPHVHPESSLQALFERFSV